MQVEFSGKELSLLLLGLDQLFPPEDRGIRLPLRDEDAAEKMRALKGRLGLAVTLYDSITAPWMSELEVGKAVPSQTEESQAGDDWVSWTVWCDWCKRDLKGPLSSRARANMIAEMHREENPDHAPNCIVVNLCVNTITELFRV
jgi:hypothetical protein